MQGNYMNFVQETIKVNLTMRWLPKSHCLTFKNSPFRHSLNCNKIADICIYIRMYVYMYLCRYVCIDFCIRYLQKKCSKVCSS